MLEPIRVRRSITEMMIYMVISVYVGFLDLLFVSFFDIAETDYKSKEYLRKFRFDVCLSNLAACRHGKLACHTMTVLCLLYTSPVLNCLHARRIKGPMPQMFLEAKKTKNVASVLFKLFCLPI